MSSQTSNLGLVKPTYEEDADIAVINGNMDTIDTKVGAVPSGTSVQAQLNKVIHGNSLGNFNAKATLDGYLNTALSSMSNDGVYAIKVVCTGTFGVFVNGYTYIGTLYKSGSNTTSSHVVLNAIGSNNIVTGLRNSSGWTYDLAALQSGITALSDQIAQFYISSGTVTSIKELTTSATNYTQTISEPGWYSVRASSGATSGQAFSRITIGNTIIMNAVADIGQYTQLLPPPIFIKSGVEIKAMAGFPTGGTGELVKIS